MTPQQLKNSILQLAIQGKLVEQRKEDGTAEELYQQVQAEKQQLIKEGTIKKEKPLLEISDDEKPYDIPESWKWARLGCLVNLLSGQDMPPSEYNNSVNGIPYITGASNIENGLIIINRWTESARAIAHKGDLLLTCKGTVGETAILTEETAHIARQIMAITPFIINTKYVQHFIENQIESLKSQAKSMIPGIARDNVLNLLVPLPPLAEQKRIVAKIEELLPYIDRYEQAWSKLEDLNKRFPVDMQKSILQYAIQGKLVEQRAEEGTGEELLSACQKDKELSIINGKYKKEPFRGAIANDDKEPFELPESWVWMHISDMALFQEGPGIMAVDFRTSGVPLIRIAGMQKEVVTKDGCNYLDKDMVKVKWSHFKLDIGDVVISTSASMDKIAEVDEDCVGAILYTGLIRFKMYGGINKEYFKQFIKSACFMSQVNEQKKGGTIKDYGPSHLRKMIIPIPPLLEQKRIVAKLEEILPLCESLK